LLVPWSELAESEGDKDRAVVHLLPVFLARAGFQIVPRQGVASVVGSVP